MRAEALVCVVSWDYAYVSRGLLQFYVDITIFRLSTFSKNLHFSMRLKINVYFILNLDRYSQIWALMFAIIHSMYLGHGKSQHINVLELPVDPLNPKSSSITAHSVHRCLAGKTKKRGRVEKYPQNPWLNLVAQQFRFHRSLAYC